MNYEITDEEKAWARELYNHNLLQYSWVLERILEKTNTLLAERNINKDDSTNSKYPTRGRKESE